MQGGAVVSAVTLREEAEHRNLPLNAKCYIYVCAGCDLLDFADRSDKMTCSTACRVRTHRNGYLKLLRDVGRRVGVYPAIILQIDAIKRLCPDLYEQLRARSLTIEDAQPEVWNAFWEVLQEQMEAAS